MNQDAVRRASSPRRVTPSPTTGSPIPSSNAKTPAGCKKEQFGRGWTLKDLGWEYYCGSHTSLTTKIGFWAAVATLFLALFATIYYAGVAIGQTDSLPVQFEQAAIVKIPSARTDISDARDGDQVDITDAWGLPPPGVLVLYNFRDTNPEYYNNLRFFLRTAIVPDDGAAYFVIVHRDVANVVELPELPKNARYLFHASDCDDWGIFGWVLKSRQIRIKEFKYFVFLNSSVRGPFLPAYIQGRIHWLNVLLSKLNDDVKLVGPTINCQPTPRGDMGDLRKNPHVQTYTIATDVEGLRVLLAHADIFKCYDSVWDTVYYSEVGLSRAILEAGYNLDCLLARYQGLNWRRPENWNCNRNMNPLVPNAFDGSSVEAMEVMFVEVKQQSVEYKVPNMEAARSYDRWTQVLQKDNFTEDILSNVYADQAEFRALFQVPMTLLLARRGMRCFDCKYYVQQNVDLPKIWVRQCRTAFLHYINNGQFELREARYTCEFDPASILPVMINASDAVHVAQGQTAGGWENAGRLGLEE